MTRRQTTLTSSNASFVQFSSLTSREEERAGEKTFDALLTQKTRTSQDDLTRLRAELRTAVRGYVGIAAFRQAIKHPKSRVVWTSSRLILTRRRRTSKQLAAALAEIDTASKDDGHLAGLMQRSEQIEASRSELATRRSTNEQQQAKSRQRAQRNGSDRSPGRSDSSRRCLAEQRG